MLIGEVAKATGVSTKTLRYYEQQGLVHEPTRTSGGYRDYPRSVIHRVVFIRQAQSAGLTLRQIGEILVIRDGGRTPCGRVAQLVDERLGDIDVRLAELRHTRAQLRQLRARLDDTDPDHMPHGGICAAVARG